MTKCLLYITIPSLFILASILWLIIAAFRRSRSFKLAAFVVVLETLILTGGYFYWLTPKDYPRNYLNQQPDVSSGLGTLASSKNFFLGAAVGNITNPHLKALIPREFNSLTPENATST